LTISSIQIGGGNYRDFYETNHCGVLLYNDSCTVQVSARPLTSGTRYSNMFIFSNDPSAPQAAYLQVIAP